MGKYMLLWQLDPTKIPVDPKERASGWKTLMGMVQQDLERGMSKDWGSFLGEGKGYAIYEGTELEVDLAMQQYVPFVEFKVFTIRSASEVQELIDALLT